MHPNGLTIPSIVGARTTILASLVVLLTILEPAAAQSSRRIDDKRISYAVRTSLLLEDSVGASDIQVVTSSNIVTLLGRVRSLHEKLRAKEVAEKVKGVSGVINQIEVARTPDRDIQIRADVLAALAREPLTNPWTIQVEVADGVVTLEGRVDSRGQRLLCERIAARIRGVRSVKNQLEHSPTPTRSDKEVKAAVETKLFADAAITPALIDVTVLAGEVTLKGSVGSADARSAAIAAAWSVSGVASVHAASLRVRWWLHQEKTNRRTRPTDEEVESAIARRFRDEPYITYKDDISVNANAGIVTLAGEVKDLPSKRIAENLVQQTRGVWGIRDYLRVKPILQPSDEEIAEVIRYALQHDPYVDRFDITVRVEDGHGYLTGKVDSWSMKQQAEEVAAHIQGLVSLKNDLTIDDQTANKSDPELEKTIRAMLQSTASLSDQDIRIDVREGVATLTGTVDTWNQERLAEDVAMKSGATSVINKLEAVPSRAQTEPTRQGEEP